MFSAYEHWPDMIKYWYTREKIIRDKARSKWIHVRKQYRCQPKPQYHEQNEDRLQPATKIK